MRFPGKARTAGATLVAIAKDEARYLVEWLAFHRAIGFDRILVYDNESSDGTAALLDALAAREPWLSRHPWPSRDGFSPQIEAYADALPRVATPWVMALDIDEFLVPFGHRGLADLIAAIPADVASLHVNWRGFGSGGRSDPDYGLVTRAFTRCSAPHWENHLHFKTLARTAHATEMVIHDIKTAHGRRVLSDLAPFGLLNAGAADRFAYAGVQINHYQCKTYPEFQARMRRGDANFPPGHPGRARDDSRARFAQLDRNDEEDLRIRAFDRPFAGQYRRLRRHLDPPPAPGDLQRRLRAFLGVKSAPLGSK